MAITLASVVPGYTLPPMAQSLGELITSEIETAYGTSLEGQARDETVMYYGMVAKSLHEHMQANPAFYRSLLGV